VKTCLEEKQNSILSPSQKPGSPLKNLSFVNVYHQQKSSTRNLANINKTTR